MSSPNLNSCIVCGKDGLRDVAYPGIHRNALAIEGIRLCNQCGLGVAHPLPTQDKLDQFYQSGAYWHVSCNSHAQLAHERNQSRHRVLRCLEYFAAGGAVADIGAGHGTIAQWLDKLAGNRVLRYDFIEPDETNSKHILAHRVRFPVSAAKTVHDLGSDYALIFLNHVLEHVADPVDFLGAIYARLRPDGIIYVETPHADHRFKEDVFPHTLFFTPPALEKLSEKLGLEVLECTAFGAYPGAPGGMSAGIFHWASIAFHIASRCGLAPLERSLDDAIWRYQPAANGMWLRCVLRRPSQ